MSPVGVRAVTAPSTWEELVHFCCFRENDLFFAAETLQRLADERDRGFAGDEMNEDFAGLGHENGPSSSSARTSASMPRER